MVSKIFLSIKHQVTFFLATVLLFGHMNLFANDRKVDFSSNVKIPEPQISKEFAKDGVRYVFLISMDGLRPDEINEMGPENLPNMYRMRVEGSLTDNARTDYDITKTLPNHACMLTGRRVTGSQGHKLDFNVDDGSTFRDLSGSYISSIWDIIHDRGLYTGMYASKRKFALYERSWNEKNGVSDTIGIDNGNDKIDEYVYNPYTSSLINTTISKLNQTPHNFCLIHLRDLDSEGHASGWGSVEYKNALRKMDHHLGKVFELIDNNSQYTNKSAVILTSDHGGNGTSHSTPSDPKVYTIPFYVWGPGVPAGVDLYVLNKTTRIDPGIGRPFYDVHPQPIRNGDAGNLVADILNIVAIPGSTINSSQDLKITASDDELDIPSVTITAPSHGKIFGESDSIKIEASVSIRNKEVSRLEFYSNWTLVGIDSITPYSYKWSPPKAGGYTITVRAVDASGIGGVHSTFVGIAPKVYSAKKVGKPVSYQLRENFPNPFNLITTITYQIPEENLVRMEIFNVSGQKIRDLVHRFEPAGSHLITWNGLDQHGKAVSSGVYYYRLSAGTYRETKKMILMR